MAEEPGDSAQLGQNQDLDDHVAGKPGKLGHLTQAIAQPFSRPQGLAPVMGHGLRPTEITEVGSEKQRHR